MKNALIAALLAFVAIPALAMQPPAQTVKPISDLTNVVMDRGSRLEVFPNQRATPVTDPIGRGVRHRISAASLNAPVSSTQLGVVFNHEMQQQGYISGEIAFQPKAGGKPSGMPAASYPGLKKITASGVYVVRATTPSEFMVVLKRLQARTDLLWVEPIVIYGAADNPPSTR